MWSGHSETRKTQVFFPSGVNKMRKMSTSFTQRKDNPEEAELIVFQARKNEMVSGKKKIKPTEASPTRNGT